MVWTRLVGTLSWAPNRQLLLLAVAYLSAIASVVSFVMGDGGGPSRLQIFLIAVPVFVLYYLGVSLESGR